MIYHRPFAKLVVRSLFSIVFLCVSFVALAQPNGKELFEANCKSCHAIDANLTGPALRGVEERVPDQKLLYAWIKNNQAVLATGNKYFNDLYVQWNKTAMNTFTGLADADIAAILKYINEAPKAGAKKDDGPGLTPGDKAAASDNSLLYGILTLILAIITLILLQVNSNLRKLADDKEGIPSAEPIAFYKNKSYIAAFAVVLFVIGGYLTIQGAVGLGRNKDYQPEQPIYYSHKVHAGTNQISCLYCHNGAFEGKHANIPSVNVCMNCHAAINEYKGEDIFKEDGTKVDGTAEIQKIYKAAGYDPATKKYSGKEQPIEWVKIHNLPDHVYFNHSQHTRAGKVQCQTCHGPIQEMGEVYQFSDLSMGWCVNCHRESKVNFYDPKTGEGNKFYSIYEKFHNDIKNKKVDSVTVEMIGGTECQKCHY
ncbi:MAG: c-type cytochrome [Flavihumibacter sp.]|nr:c-type cytochrome [Flavihumibacter sp.]